MSDIIEEKEIPNEDEDIPEDEFDEDPDTIVDIDETEPIDDEKEQSTS